MSYKNFLISTLSSIIQYYNYALFGICSINLADNFMPGDHSEQRILNFFFAIMITVLARPLGSIIFGYIGDTYGRKYGVILAGLIGSLGALSVFFIPKYSNVGLIASFLLILSRMQFLSGLAGEIDGIRLFISESVSKSFQFTGNGLITMLTQCGTISAGLLLYHFSGENNWKYCFLIGGILGIITTFLRIYLPESKEFSKSNESPESYYKVSFFQILNGQLGLLLKAIILFGTVGASFQYCVIFFTSYSKIEIGMNHSSRIPLYALLYGVGGVFWGYLSDKIGGKRIINIVTLFSLVLFVMLIFGIKSEDHNQIYYTIMLICFFLSGFSVPVQILLKQNINVGIRYRIFSLSHSLGSLFLSTPTGYICSKLAINYGLFITPLFLIILIFICRNLVTDLVDYRR